MDTNCPKCKKSDRMAEIMYGYPDPDYKDQIKRELKEGKIVLGGCCISEDSPKYYCKRCHKYFGIFMKQSK